MQDLNLNGRRIYVVEYDTAKNWQNRLPNSNWLCILASDDRRRQYLDEVINKIIAKDVCWVATIGDQCELIHELFDEEIVFRQADIDTLYLPKHNIMTTYHRDFQKGIWFSIFAAHDEEFEIETIVILDLTNGARKKEIAFVLESLDFGLKK